METIDDETVTAALDFIDRQVKAGKPFFVWWNGTHMHFRTHVADKDRGISGQDEYSDGMVLHDRAVGVLPEKARRPRHRRQHHRPLLDRQRPAPEHLAGCRNDAVPQREEHQLGRRLARAGDGALAGAHQARLGLQRHHASHGLAADLPRRRRRRRTSSRNCSTATPREERPTRCIWMATTRCPYLTGQEDKGPRKEIFYFSDDGDLMALRYEDWKVVFMEQRATGTLRIWAEPFTPLRVPKIFNLRRDPYERADITSNTYYDWMISRAYALVPAQAYVGKFLETFKAFSAAAEAGELHRRRADGSSGEVAVEAEGDID